MVPTNTDVPFLQNQSHQPIKGKLSATNWSFHLPCLDRLGSHRRLKGGKLQNAVSHNNFPLFFICIDLLCIVSSEWQRLACLRMSSKVNVCEMAIEWNETTNNQSVPSAWIWKLLRKVEISWNRTLLWYGWLPGLECGGGSHSNEEERLEKCWCSKECQWLRLTDYTHQ